MKQFKFLWILTAGLLTLGLVSCQNQDIEFPDFDYSTVYFPYQYPVRTMVLGDDIYDNTLDNEHKIKIYATVGGLYQNKKSISIDVEVNNALTNNLFFGDDSPVLAMPSNYYSLAASKITLNGTLQDGVEVQLTDAFFADPKAVENTYVIPLQMKNVTNADSILSGIPKDDGAVRPNLADWEVQPKDFVLYCVKFINPWHAYYLRRGEDVITEGGETTTNVRRQEFVEKDEVVHMKTISMNSVEYPVTVVNTGNTNQTVNLILTFDNDNRCTVSTTTEGFTASGTGSFVKDGEKQSWGNKDRNAIYLDYTIDMVGKSYASTDTLVVRDRGITMETFSPSYVVN